MKRVEMKLIMQICENKGFDGSIKNNIAEQVIKLERDLLVGELKRTNLMKQLFFQKGQKEDFSPNGEWFCETSSNLDSKKYILERIPFHHFSKQQNYIQNHFYFQRHDNLISYFTCWKESQNLPQDKPLPKDKDKKKDKKTMLDIMKRKTKIQTQSTVPQSKKKITDDHLNENLIQQQFLYVQIEYFSQIEIPNDFTSLRDLMAIIYLLGKRIQRQMGSFPCLIPVKNQENDRIKFFKKGVNEQTELCRLMNYLFREKQQTYLRQWSETLQKAIHKSMINRDQMLIGSLLQNAIEQHINQPYTICLFKEEEKLSSIETVRIIDHQIILLQESQIELPLCEYSIEYLLKSENDREITLTHEVFEKYTLSGKKNNFIVKWLYHMAT